MEEETRTRHNRIPVMLSDRELQELDDFMFAQRIRGRSEAIRRLLALGLQHAPAAPAPRPAPRKRPAQRLGMAREARVAMRESE